MGGGYGIGIIRVGGWGACVVWALEGRGGAGRDRGVFQSVEDRGTTRHGKA